MMKKLLLQLDTDKHPSSFDRIVPYDADVDEVLSYGGVTDEDVPGLVQGAFFTRGIPDLKNTAVWIGGSDVAQGERLLVAAKRSFFGPFKVSLMLASKDCNTTAATAIAKLAKQMNLQQKRAVVIGPGPVGLRAALLLAREGCSVTLTSIPADLLGDRYNADLTRQSLESARSVAAAQTGGDLEITETTDVASLEQTLQNAEIAVTAGPPGVQLLPQSLWASHPTLRLLLDFNLTEPLGIEGIKSSDHFTEREGKQVLGPLAIGNPKMKVHKACLRRLFEQNDLVLDAPGVYEIAKDFV